MRLDRRALPFARDTRGAVTIDWVVLSASVMGLAVLAVLTAADAADDLWPTITDAMEAAGIGTSKQPAP